MGIRVGDNAQHEFTVEVEEMKWFQTVSRDHSRIHTDSDFCRERGFDDVIVYGGIVLAHLSHVLGTKIPGKNGTSTRWTINYRQPLYLGETARIELTVTYISKAAGVVESKFKINAGAKVIATGDTQSILPVEEIDE
ncbi:MAG: hypothetical protein B7Y80_18645 [Hyphomicrobium sp. 32-62-53]|nr:MAG: hypothetical protein B7Y80_18645 [Hyphomicrobium sp. 32-62-53]